MYAESKPADPMGKLGKIFVDAQSQAYDIPSKIGMDLPMNEDSDDEM